MSQESNNFEREQIELSAKISAIISSVGMGILLVSRNQENETVGGIVKYISVIPESLGAILFFRALWLDREHNRKNKQNLDKK